MGKRGQVELSHVLKDWPADRLALLGEWKAPGTPRQTSVWIFWYSLLNPSRDKCAGSHPHDHGLLRRRDSIGTFVNFLIPVAKSA